MLDGPASPLGLLLYTPWGYAFAAVWGAIWGSFFNVAAHRLAHEEARLRDVVWPPSSCPACGARIRSRDNLPIVGWLLLGGRCRDCRAPISVRYPIVEAASALLAVAVFHVFVAEQPDAPAIMTSRFLVYFAFAGVLLTLSIIDWDTMLLPEAITLPAIPFFFVCGRIVGDVPIVDAGIGLVVGFGALKGLQLGYAAATGREGLGGGDAMLMAIVGGLLGWRALPFTLGIGALLGTMVTLPMLLWQRRRDAAVQQRDGALQQSDAALQQGEAGSGSGSGSGLEMEADVPIGQVEVPFGPFLAAGALLYLFFRDAAWAWVAGMTEPV